MLVKESWPGNLHMDRKRHYSVSMIVYRRKSLVLIKVASWRKTITNNFGAYLCIKTRLYVFVCMCLCRGQSSTLGAFLSFFLHYFLRQKFSLNPEFTDSTRLTGQKVPGTLVALSSLHQLYEYKLLLPCLTFVFVWVFILMFVWKILHDWITSSAQPFSSF